MSAPDVVETLTAILNTERRGSAGPHERIVPAGSVLEVAVCAGRDWHRASVTGRPRLKVWVRIDHLDIP